jgi:hypothetical protein
MRRAVFDAPQYRKRYPLRVGEDLIIILIALKNGWRFGYLNNVHTIYHVHAENTSTPQGGQASIDKQLRSCQEQMSAYEQVQQELPMTPAERRAAARMLAHTYFWSIGYTLLWQSGRGKEALEMFYKGLSWWPWDLRCWKTYLLALARTCVLRQSPRPSL